MPYLVRPSFLLRRPPVFCMLASSIIMTRLHSCRTELIFRKHQNCICIFFHFTTRRWHRSWAHKKTLSKQSQEDNLELQYQNVNLINTPLSFNLRGLLWISIYIVLLLAQGHMWCWYDLPPFFFRKHECTFLFFVGRLSETNPKPEWKGWNKMLGFPRTNCWLNTFFLSKCLDGNAAKTSKRDLKPDDSFRY